MSKRLVCSVFDSASRLYSQPIFMPSQGAAIRAFSDEVNREARDNPFFMHPEDYEIRGLAIWDDEDGTFSVLDNAPVLLARGKDVTTKGGVK